MRKRRREAGPLLHDHLETQRLTLRRPSCRDIETIYAIHSNPQTWEHNPGDALGSLHDAAELLQRWDAHWLAHGYGYFSIDLCNYGNTIGFCGIKIVTFHGRRVLNLFYRLDPAFWGQGFASEAVEAVIQYADQQLPGLAIIARVRPANTASHRIVTKLGLTRQPSLSEVGVDGFEHIYTRRWTTQP